MAVRCAGSSQWCNGSGRLVDEPLRVYGAGFEAADVQCPECDLRLNSTTKFVSGKWWVIPDHGVSEAPNYGPTVPKAAESDNPPVPVTVTAMAPTTGRAAAIWEEYVDINAWTRTQQCYATEAQKMAARIIVGINSIPELSLLTVIENAQRARNAFTFRQSVAGLLPNSIPSEFSGAWDIVLAYYKKVGDR